VRMHRALVLAVAMALTAAVPAAQARAQGGGSDSKTPPPAKAGEPGGPMDQERPIPFMIEHHKDLDLADSQVTQLGIIQNKLDAADRPAHLAMDTLPAAPSGPIDYAHLTPGARDSIIARRRAVSQANAALHDNALGARNQALALLTPDQQKKLQSINQSIVNKLIDAERKPASGGNSPGVGRPGGAPGAGGRPY
jgi:Spy/CpxP family protein refolding chaperone